VSTPALLEPLTVRGLTLRNRLVVDPMCQYSVDDGLVGD
jgi:2,4-dienoyl-CoA reductase-like NADH-dependent reductase (Old Yellow Enzyme family)